MSSSLLLRHKSTNNKDLSKNDTERMELKIVGIRFVKRLAVGLTLMVGVHCSNAIAQDVEEEIQDSTKQKPFMVFGAGVGATYFTGDVRDASDRATVHLIGNRFAYDVNVGVGLSKSFVLNLNAVYGKLSGNENTFRQNRNFETQMVLAGVNVEYNFRGLWKKKAPVISPLLIAGVYYSNYFDISTDLAGDNSRAYYYWSDGKIRDIAETAANSDDAELMSRDFNYETSLVQGQVHSFSAALGFGLDLHLSKALALRLQSRYFFALTDQVDGYSTSGIASMRDGFFFNQIGLIVNTASFGKNRKSEEPAYKYLFDFAQLEEQESEDLDGDGVLDIVDKCAATPTGVIVDKHGCPLDIDKDGIPDYRDANTSTEEGKIVDATGELVDYEIEEERWVDSQGAQVISWNKKYPNPRYAREGNYTVAISMSKQVTLNETALLKQYPKLTKKELSDSLVVYSMGTFEKFEDAAKESQNINARVSHDAYVVTPEYIEQVAFEFDGFSIPDSVKNRDSYGMAQSIQKVKTSESYRRPQLESTVKRFENHINNGVPESVLVEQYLRGIAPFAWDKTVKESYVEVNKKLKANPVAKPMEVLASVATPNTSEKTESISSENVKVSTAQVDQPKELETSVEKVKLLAEFKLSPTAKLEFMPTKEKFKLADINSDGLIWYSEIEVVLNAIVEGRGKMNVEEFNEMVVEFTDFTENVDPVDFGGTKAAYVDGKLTIFKPANTELEEDTRRLLAGKYEKADFNRDGELSPDEVQKLIAMFMEGEAIYPSEKIYELIDLYFE